jgi:hypothetical protein
MTFSLRYIEPIQLRGYWPAVKEGLEECLQHDSTGALPEDVYTAIKTNAATLHVGEEHGRMIGFVVLNQIANPFTGVPRLNIWCLHAKGYAGKELMTLGLSEIEVMAERIGATEITFRPDTLALSKLFEPLGFRLREVEMVKEI